MGLKEKANNINDMELKELVKGKLKMKKANKKSILLCGKIFDLHAEYSPSKIKEKIKEEVNEIVAPAEKEIREMKKIAPPLARKKRR